ncbi:MAG: cob(I)yrinic acid a,c-diamide adenosyltransferase [Bifidobacteriaceae bacterium]|nr:cob(I)yrinic acid a,c-diamide adenosyltransferase [Bifidobacteriaceae bacterium]
MTENVTKPRETMTAAAENLVKNAPHGPKIYTRHGDKGSSIQIDGTKLSKSDPQIIALGSLDAAQSWIGLVIAELSDACAELREPLITIQQKFYQVQSDIAVPGCEFIDDDDTAALEQAIDGFMSHVETIPAFVLPGGSPTGARLHYARTLTRTAERACVSFNEAKACRVRPEDLKFINRLSDYLFAMARYANHLDGTCEAIARKPQD